MILSPVNINPDSRSRTIWKSLVLRDGLGTLGISEPFGTTTRLKNIVPKALNYLLAFLGKGTWLESVRPQGTPHVVSGSRDNIVQLWEATTGTSLQTLEGHFGPVASVAFSPDSKKVVSGSGDNTVRLWDAATGASLQTLEGYSGGVASVTFSPRLWSEPDPECLRGGTFDCQLPSPVGSEYKDSAIDLY
jgi:WD40 repeat protein